MLAFSNDYYGMIFRATQSVELFCAYRQITALTNRIAILEDKALKKAGRKRVPIYLDGRELTDDDILYYIDEDYYTIVELERVTKAPKNLIRNRYNRAKKKQRIAKEDTIPSFV